MTPRPRILDLLDRIAALETRLRAIRAESVALHRDGGHVQRIGKLTAEARRLNRELTDLILGNSDR